MLVTSINQIWVWSCGLSPKKYLTSIVIISDSTYSKFCCILELNSDLSTF
jgi:hypothetical protein